MDTRARGWAGHLSLDYMAVSRRIWRVRGPLGELPVVASVWARRRALQDSREYLKRAPVA